MRSLLNDAEYREPAELGEGHQRAIGPDNIEGHGSSQEPVNVVREVGDRRILDHIDDEEMLLKGSGMRLGAAQKRSEEHTSELQSLMRISYAVFCLKKTHKTITRMQTQNHTQMLRL